MAYVLHDHIHVNIGIANRFENAGGHAGLVRHAHQRDFGLVFVERHAAHDNILHTGRFFFHKGSFIFV